MINAAIYGIGRWGQVLVKSVQGASEKIRFTSAIASAGSKTRAFAADLDITATDDYAAVLADAEIDAVVLASPPWLHAEQVEMAAAAGKPVFVEKPFALKHDQAVAAAAACDAAGVPLCVGFNRRFLPAIIDMRDMIATGRIGVVQHMECQFSGPTALRTPIDTWRALGDNNPAGGMVARGLHILDAMIYQCGEVQSVFADSDRRETENPMHDTTSILLRFNSGETGYLSTMMATGDYMRIQILGSGGWMELRGEDTLIISDLDAVTETKTYAPIDKEKAELEAFADVVTGDGAFPVLPAQAIHGVAVHEAITASAARGEKVGVKK